MRFLVRVLRSIQRRRHAERDMRDEFRLHLELETEALRREGASPLEARRRAAAAFGGVEAHKDAARDVRALAWADDLSRDVRHACRQVRRSPAFAGVVIGTLAIGIAATVTIFSIVNGVLLRPLPYSEPDRLVAVTGLHYKGEFVRLRDTARTLSVGAGSGPFPVTLTGRGEPVRLTAARASAELFAVLGVAPALGRTFVAAEGQGGAAATVVLSDPGWRRHFGSASDIVGRAVMLDGTPRTVVGVMPADFVMPGQSVDLWVPLVLRESDAVEMWSQSAPMLGRLRAGATFQTARDELRSYVPGFRASFPWKMPADYGSDAGVIPLQAHVVGDVRQALMVLLAAVGALLAIVCVNVASLMLARGMARQREMAVRAAIGAGAARLFRQMMAESLTLALAAGALGLVGSNWALAAVIARLPAGMPRVQDIALDARVFGFTAGLSIVTGLVFGLWPAMRAARARIEPSLREAGRSTGLAPGPRRMAHALAMSELALAVVLVTSAALLVQSFRNLTAVDPGFVTDRLVTATVAPPATRYADAASRGAFVEQLLDRLRQSPGVTAVSAASAVPLGPPAFGAVFTIEGRPDPATQSGDWPLADVAATVEPAYFATMGMRLEAGRAFSGDDRAGSLPVAVISRSLASQHWRGGSALGARIRLPGAREWLTVVGVVGDVAWGSLADKETRSLYRPLAQAPMQSISVAVRTARDPAPLIAALRGVVGSLDRDTPVSDIRTAEALREASVAGPRLTASLLSMFALVALLLGALGVYGVLAYTVSRRTQEIGVRLALGARPADVRRLVLRQGAGIAAAGVASGLAIALAATRGLSSQLFGVQATDPAVFAGVAATLTVVALAASWIPALRASRVDPLAALRADQ